MKIWKKLSRVQNVLLQVGGYFLGLEVLFCINWCVNSSCYQHLSKLETSKHPKIYYKQIHSSLHHVEIHFTKYKCDVLRIQVNTTSFPILETSTHAIQKIWSCLNSCSICFNNLSPSKYSFNISMFGLWSPPPLGSTIVANSSLMNFSLRIGILFKWIYYTWTLKVDDKCKLGYVKKQF